MANANGGDSVTELRAASGALVKVISGSRYRLNGPAGVSSDGTHVWIVNQTGNSVTELNAATGIPAKVINASGYGFNFPRAISSDGMDVWVANMADQSVTGFPT